MVDCHWVLDHHHASLANRAYLSCTCYENNVHPSSKIRMPTWTGFLDELGNEPKLGNGFILKLADNFTLCGPTFKKPPGTQMLP
jgi:hypothetical protein